MACLASLRAEAQDECRTDEECVELYTEGFTCATGVLGRYCVEPACVDCWGWDDGEGWEEASPLVACTTDAECLEARGEGWACPEGECVRHECDLDADCASSHGPAWNCVDWGGGGKVCEEDLGYVPPFRSCAVAPRRVVPRDDRLVAVLAGVVALALGARRRRR